jgi:vacuolar-type H+-ATPase subunit I/STV1
MSRATTNHSFAPQGESDHPSNPASMEARSPAQAFSLVIGVALVVAGILGFFYNASFATGDGTDRDAVLGILDVNGWHNVVHVLTGAIGLAVSGAYDGSRAYALGFGAIYLVVALLGFVAGDGDEILNLIPVNTEDNVLHLLIGFAGVGAGVATPSTPAPSTG